MADEMLFPRRELRRRKTDSTTSKDNSKRCESCNKVVWDEHVRSTLRCSLCSRLFHAKCQQVSGKLAQAASKYDWQCYMCKRCQVCGSGDDEKQTLLCDGCDRGFHMYCLEPPLLKRPKTEWMCPVCEQESSLPSTPLRLPSTQTTPGPSPSPADRSGRTTPVTTRGKLDGVPSSLSVSVTSSTSRTGSSGGTGGGRGKKRKLKKENVQAISPLRPPPTPSPYKRAKKCRTPGCNGIGNMSGEHESHQTASTCPIYHNLAGKECTELYTDRLRSVGKRQDSSHITTGTVEYWSSKRAQINVDLIAHHSLKAELLKKHREKHVRTREPPLEGLTTAKDYYLFRQAQSILASKMENGIVDPRMNDVGTSIQTVVIGPYEVGTWYPSPYPITPATLYICEFCLKYMKCVDQLTSHMEKCQMLYPPGDEIYRQGKLSIWEVDGKRNIPYCQQLCLLAKLFLDHKTLYYDVEPFLFYVLTEATERGCILLGYFSKEKRSFMHCNLSCIMTLPQHQRKGYGRLLIDFSYLLSRTENNKLGSPERPLSDLGLLAYRNYWLDTILEEIEDENEQISIKEVSRKTGIKPDDIISTLQVYGMVKNYKNRYWIYFIKDILEEFRERRKRGRIPRVDPSLLQWKPHPETLQNP